MWQIGALLSVAGGLQSARQLRKAGSAALLESKAQASEIRRQKQDIALLASQQHQDRMEQFADLVAYNDAATAYMGRTGRSIAALRKREERLYGRDVTRIREQEAREKEAAEKQAAATEARGVSAQKAYKQQAKTSLLQTAIKAGDLV